MATVKAVLLTIDDPVYLPGVFAPLFVSQLLELRQVVLIPPLRALNMHPGGSLGMPAVWRRRGMYGTGALGKMILRHVAAIPRSLCALSKEHGVPVLHWEGSVNDPVLLSCLNDISPDIIVGVFSERAGSELRGLARNGLILLHYSHLPEFAGREPVFWCLLEEPEAGGVTFFEPGESFDRGRIAARGRLDLSDCQSLHEGIETLGALAAQLVVEAATRAAVDRLAIPQQRDALRPFPQRQDRQRFLQKGLRFA